MSSHREHKRELLTDLLEIYSFKKLNVCEKQVLMIPILLLLGLVMHSFFRKENDQKRLTNRYRKLSHK